MMEWFIILGLVVIGSYGAYEAQKNRRRFEIVMARLNELTGRETDADLDDEPEKTATSGKGIEIR